MRAGGLKGMNVVIVVKSVSHRSYPFYADSNDVYEALSVAFNEVLEEIKKNQAMPEFGVVSSHSSVRMNDDLEEI